MKLNLFPPFPCGTMSVDHLGNVESFEFQKSRERERNYFRFFHMFKHFKERKSATSLKVVQTNFFDWIFSSEVRMVLFNVSNTVQIFSSKIHCVKYREERRLCLP